jgi:threonine dehydrogenase-like Zn-dependent dehydrogenase
MRAAVMRDSKIVVDEVPDPEPGDGQVLVKTLACGICGSDLHMLKFAREMAELAAESGQPGMMDPDRDVVMGHEFCAEILDHGPNTQKTLKAGTRVCSMPVLLGASGFNAVGYSNDVPGGYAERMVLNEMMLLEVPNGLATEHAALTEPMAVGLHAVEKARLTPQDVALVIGCGPVGLSVISALEIRGVGPIIAADFSPMRRRLAEAAGADIIVDPAQTSPYESWAEAARLGDAAQAPGPFGGLAPALRPGVLFECVGVPGVIEAMMKGAPRDARIVVVGVCMEIDHLRPIMGVSKELSLQFALGYSPLEFAETLRNIAEGKVVVEPLVTGQVGVEGVAGAFEELASPDKHAKILVEPWR